MTTRSPGSAAAGPAALLARPGPSASLAARGRPAAARLRPADLARLAVTGLRTRKLRAALSGLGVAIGGAGGPGAAPRPGRGARRGRLGSAGGGSEHGR